MKVTILFGLIILIGLGMSPGARADVVMTLEQVGSNVVATGSGTLDLTGLTYAGTYNGAAEVYPAAGDLLEGNGGTFDIYQGITSVNGSFGTGAETLASTSTGDPLGVGGANSYIFVSQSYVSGTALSSTATFDNTTLAALGVTAGIYTWTWGGTGPADDSITLYAGVPAPSSTPEPASLLLSGLGLFAGLGAAKLRRKHS